MIDETWTPTLVDFGDHRARQDEDEGRGDERHDRRQHGAEGEHEQDDDEQERQLLGLVLRGAGRSDGIDLDRQLAGQVDLQAGLSSAARERGPDVVDHALGFGTGTERDDRRLDERLPGLAVARHAEIDHGLDVIDGADPTLDGIDRGVVGRGQAAIAGGDERRRRERHVLEGSRHTGRLHARSARGEETTGRVLGDIAQRRQQPDGQDGDDEPGEHDEEAKPDRESAETPEEAAHACPFNGGSRNPTTRDTRSGRRVRTRAYPKTGATRNPSGVAAATCLG